MEFLRLVRTPTLMLAAALALLSVAPAGGQVSIERARTLVTERKDAEEAQKVLRALLAQSPQQPEANFLLASVLYDFRRYEDAEPLAEKAASLDGRNSRAHLLLGKVYAAQIQKAGMFGKVELLRKARAEFEKAVEANPKDVAARRALASLVAETPGMLGGSMEDAMAQAAEIEKIDPAEGHLARADLFGVQKKPREAEQECRRAAEAAGQRADVHARAGTILLLNGLKDQAWPYFEKALALDPQNTVAAYQLARRSIETGKDLDKAEPLLRLNLERWPREEGVSWAHTHWRLGQLYDKLGKRDQARRELEVALKLRPDLKGAKEDLDKLRKNGTPAR